MDRLEVLLSKGLVIYAHYPEDYAYLGFPGDSEGCKSFPVTLEYVQGHSIPISRVDNKWFKFPNGEEFPEGF
ncbi:MAG: hypothetical protein WCP87_04095 [Atribacterota bacterium]